MRQTNSLEQDLVNYFIDKVKRCARAEGIPCDFVQIETGATAIGVPDALMFLGNFTFWIEFKKMKGQTSRASVHDTAKNVGGHLKFQPGQLRMLHRLIDHNEKAFVCAITESQDAMFIPPNKLPLDGGGAARCPKDCMLYAYPSIWEGLKVFLTEEFTDVIAWKEIPSPSVCLTETEGEGDWVVPDKEPL